MDKKILIQYCEMQEEIKDIRHRIRALEDQISKLTEVSDSVKGTRHDGTYGSIRISGYPMPEYDRKRRVIEAYTRLLETKEAELLELTVKAEEYIESIPKSELRIMFRLYYLDGLTWVQVARQMNSIFPNRKVKYTDENCKKRNLRFFENVSQCPEEK